MTEPAGTIMVSRPRRAWRDRLGAYDIMVDGSPAGQIRPGGQVTVDVLPGVHRVRVRIDWTGSPELDVVVHSGLTTALVVEPAGSAFQPWQVFGTTHYLRLRQQSDPT